MADFRTHIATSGVIGVGYGTAGFFLIEDLPLTTSVLAGCLCCVSGMLPDLDSDSGIPLRESVAFTAAVVPMFMVERFSRLLHSPEAIVLFSALIYLLIRFVLSRMLKNFTVHRGMFHSLPAAIIAAQLGFLVCASGTLEARFFKAGAIFVGYMTHLILDEIWSLEWYRGRLTPKKSFGTAVKLWGRSHWANALAYTQMALLTYVVINDSHWMEQLTPQAQQWHQYASEFQETLRR